MTQSTQSHSSPSPSLSGSEHWPVQSGRTHTRLQVLGPVGVHMGGIQSALLSVSLPFSLTSTKTYPSLRGKKGRKGKNKEKPAHFHTPVSSNGLFAHSAPEP